MPEPYPPLRVFLDTNVLISATRLEASRFLSFWQMSNVTLVISPYVILETLNHVQGSSLQRFESLLKQMERVANSSVRELPPDVAIAEKDVPVLASALSSQVDVLLTGDKNHFGHLYGRTLERTLILPPGAFLEREIHRLNPPRLR